MASDYELRLTTITCFHCKKEKTLPYGVGVLNHPYKEFVRSKPRCFCSYTCLCAFRRNREKPVEDRRVKMLKSAEKLREEYNKRAATMRSKTKEKAERIFAMLREQKHPNEIAKEMGMTRQYVRRIYREWRNEYGELDDALWQTSRNK